MQIRNDHSRTCQLLCMTRCKWVQYTNQQIISPVTCRHSLCLFSNEWCFQSSSKILTIAYLSLYLPQMRFRVGKLWEFASSCDMSFVPTDLPSTQGMPHNINIYFNLENRGGWYSRYQLPAVCNLAFGQSDALVFLEATLREEGQGI